MNRWPFAVIWAAALVSTMFGACRQTAPRVQTFIELSGYASALDRCRELGRDAGSYAVYEDCAQKADAIYGRIGE